MGVFLTCDTEFINQSTRIYSELLKVKQDWPIVILGLTAFKCPLQSVNKAQSHYIMYQIKGKKLKFMINYAVLLKI